MLRATRALREGRVFLFMLVAMSAGTAHGQTTAFTYQGQLSDAGALANGSYDVRFALFDSAAGGAQIGANQGVPAVPVSAGVFTVQLDFGVNAFPGANRFVEIGVKPAGGGSYTTLAPRQQISSSPYAIRTLSAATADALSSACVGCVKDTQIQTVAGSKVSGTIPAASLPTGSGNYIQNTTAQQANSNFNIAGNGIVGGNLTVAGTLNANVSGNFIQNRTTPQAGGNFNVGGNGTVGGVLSAGSVGIGTAAPQATLDVIGTTQLAAGGGGGKIFFGTPNAETGMTISGTNRADVRFDGTTLKLLAGPGITSPANGVAIDTAGNVGIGSFAPQNKLVVNAGGSGGAVNFGTPSGESGLAIIGTNRADVRFDGTTLKLLAGTGPGAMASTNGIAINAVGNVGIGTTTPAHRLSLIGGPLWTSFSWTGALELGNAAAVGWQANAGGQHFGIGQSTGGLYFFRTTSNPGTTGSPPNYDFQIGDGGELHAYGNAEQARDKGGWVKAMALINRDGGVVRCYNSQLPTNTASTPPCGITAHRGGDGGAYNVTFNFQVDDRFISVTASRDTDFIVANIGALNGNSVAVNTALNSETNGIAQNSSPAQFTIFVY